MKSESTSFEKFLVILYNWLNSEPRGVGTADPVKDGPGFHLFPDMGLYTQDKPDGWYLQCVFETPLNPELDGYTGNFLVDLHDVPEVFEWIDGEYLVQKQEDEEIVDTLLTTWMGLFYDYLSEGGIFEDDDTDHKIYQT